MYKICDFFASGDQAIRDFDRSVLIAHHFANPSTGYYAWYAQVMDECNLDYDVFATSYYPYWHGTTENLTTVLKEIADTYNKYVMVAETAYPYTSEDGDTFGNAVSEDSDSAVFRYDVSVEGQAQCLTDVFQAVANVGEKGIGVFYWEPAWLGVNGISWEEQSSLWKKYGSGWATDYAAEYDASVTGSGGSSYDNQALFDFEGNSLKSLQVFRNIYPQNTEILNPKGAVIENGRYRIKNVNSELFISEKNGNAVQSNGTVWTFTKNNDETFYITTLDGMALTVEKSADTNGTNILLQKHKGDTSQKYTLCRNTDGTYALLTAASDNKSCLDVYNISKEDGANICQWEYWGGNGQKFILEPVKEIEGDVNADGALSVTDAVLLQKWLLAVPDAKLTDWKAADLCEDNIINVLDLHLLKRMLLEQ